MLGILQGSCAFAQTSGSVSFVSDYRFRGESLSDGRPEPQLAVSYDHPSGAYAGAFASKVDLEEKHSDTQADVYAGYAGRLNSRTSWEAGVTESMFLRASRWNYEEIYAGLGIDSLEGRIYFSPNYFGQDIRTVYMEINGSYPLSEKWRLVAHAGTLRSSSDREDRDNNATTSARQDYRIGLSTNLFNWNFQLEWVLSDEKQNQYPVYRLSSPSTVVLAASYSF